MLPNQHDAITFNTDYTDRKNITVLNSQVEEISAEDTSYVYLLHKMNYIWNSYNL